jgi:hypothetical protein
MNAIPWRPGHWDWNDPASQVRAAPLSSARQLGGLVALSDSAPLVSVCGVMWGGSGIHRRFQKITRLRIRW